MRNYLSAQGILRTSYWKNEYGLWVANFMDTDALQESPPGHFLRWRCSLGPRDTATEHKIEPPPSESSGAGPGSVCLHPHTRSPMRRPSTRSSQLNLHRSSYRSVSLIPLALHDWFIATEPSIIFPTDPPSLFPQTTHHTPKTLSLTPQSPFLLLLTPYRSPQGSLSHRSHHLYHRPHQWPLRIPISDLWEFSSFTTQISNCSTYITL